MGTLNIFLIKHVNTSINIDNFDGIWIQDNEKFSPFVINSIFKNLNIFEINMTL